MFYDLLLAIFTLVKRDIIVKFINLSLDVNLRENFGESILL